MSATQAELDATRKLMGEVHNLLSAGMESGVVTREDVVSALLNLLAHHALKLGWSHEELLWWVSEAYLTHPKNCGMHAKEKHP